MNGMKCYLISIAIFSGLFAGCAHNSYSNATNGSKDNITDRVGSLMASGNYVKAKELAKSESGFFGYLPIQVNGNKINLKYFFLESAIQWEEDNNKRSCETASVYNSVLNGDYELGNPFKIPRTYLLEAICENWLPNTGNKYLSEHQNPSPKDLKAIRIFMEKYSAFNFCKHKDELRNKVQIIESNANSKIKAMANSKECNVASEIYNICASNSMLGYGSDTQHLGRDGVLYTLNPSKPLNATMAKSLYNFRQLTGTDFNWSNCTKDYNMDMMKKCAWSDAYTNSGQHNGRCN